MSRSTICKSHNIKFIPTWKLEEIIANGYRGIDGADYGTIPEYLDEVLWERQNRHSERDIKAQLREMEMFDDELPPPLPLELSDDREPWEDEMEIPAIPITTLGGIL